MPYHYDSMKTMKPKQEQAKQTKKKEQEKQTKTKEVKPLNKPRKQLSKLQKDYMKKHSPLHSKEHNAEMIKLMKKGYCIEQSHKLAMKNVGK